MAPSHILRHQARVFAARAGTAVALFLAIAVVLLAGGSNGPLTNAQANDGGQPNGDVAQPVEEPVLGGGNGPAGDTGSAPGDERSTGQPPVEEPAPGDQQPATGGDQPTTSDEQPATGDDQPTTGSDEPTTSGDQPTTDGDQPTPGGDQPSGAEPGEGERTGEPPTDDSTSGGDKADSGTTDPDSPPADEQDQSPPSGGSKGDDTADGSPDVEEPAPDPNSRPQVTLPEETGVEPGPASPPVTEPGTPDVVVGDGDGSVTDPDEQGGGSEPDHTVKFGTAAGNDGGTSAGGGTGGTGGTGALPAGTQLAALQPGEDQPGGGAGGGGNAGNRDDGGAGAGDEGNNVVTNTVERLVEVVPDELKAALAALAALSVMLGIGYLLAALRARRLARQRSELLQEVGLLQTALLPPVPDKLGALLTSVAYRPADGPGAGGDFYDVLPLTGGRVGFILGDVSGHGRGALARTAFMRYTLRAYLEAGLEPRVALQVAGRVIDDNLGGDFATVLLAVHDPDTGSLTYASAGHPAPIVVGPQQHDPITAASSPPIGVGVRTGLRQTTVPLVPGAVAALFTDGLMEARTPDGILGRERLTELLAEIGDDATARRLIERVASEANVRSDDMAAVVVTPTAGVTTGLFRTEQLELSARELEGPMARRFLEACGLSGQEVDDAERDARLLAERFGGVVLHVVFGNRLRVEVLPRNVESIEAASRRVSAGNPQ